MSTGCLVCLQVVLLLQSTIAMREQLAAWPGRAANAANKHPETSSKEPFLEPLVAEPGGSGATERLNVFEQFKIPFDSPGKQESTATDSEHREKTSASTAVVRKTLLKSPADATSVVAGKKNSEQAWSSSMGEDAKEVFGMSL